MTDLFRTTGFVVSILAAVFLVVLLATAIAGGQFTRDLWSSPAFWAYLALGLATVGGAPFCRPLSVRTDA